jgi:hypothetical protein
MQRPQIDRSADLHALIGQRVVGQGTTACAPIREAGGRFLAQPVPQGKRATWEQL